MSLKHSCFELYNIHPSSFENLPYREALQVKIVGANKAMDKYRELARAQYPLWGIKHDKITKMYLNSEKAREFNRALIKELDE